MGTRRVEMTWAGAPKWATRDAGDAISVVEGVPGRVVGVIVDVQGSGPGSGLLARSMVTLADQLAGEGLDASSIASALNRSLWTRRWGRVLADVAVVIVPCTGTVEIARYGAMSLVAISSGAEQPSACVGAAGGDPDAEPTVDRLGALGATIVVCSDGVADSSEQLSDLLGPDPAVSHSASEVVRRALARDHGRAKNDMSTIVARRFEEVEEGLVSTEGQLTVGRRVPTA